LSICLRAKNNTKKVHSDAKLDSNQYKVVLVKLLSSSKISQLPVRQAVNLVGKNITEKAPEATTQMFTREFVCFD